MLAVEKAALHGHFESWLRLWTPSGRIPTLLAMLEMFADDISLLDAIAAKMDIAMDQCRDKCPNGPHAHTHEYVHICTLIQACIQHAHAQVHTCEYCKHASYMYMRADMRICPTVLSASGLPN